MTTKLGTRGIANNAVTIAQIASSAQQAILANKLIPTRRGVLAFTTGTSTSDVVTTQVTAAALTLAPQTSLTSGLGVYTGTITNGGADAKIVVLRLAGTVDGIDDGTSTGNEVYGVMTQASGVYTVSYYKSTGAAYTFASATSIDFYFVEIQNLNILSSDALLLGSVSGVVNATEAAQLANHLAAGGTKHTAAQISIVTAGNYYLTSDSVDSALHKVDAQVATNTANITTLMGTAAQTAAGAQITLSSTNITNGYVDLASVPNTPALVEMTPVGFPLQTYGTDFTVITNGTAVQRLTWNPASSGGPSSGMMSDLIAGDVLQVYWQVG